MYRIRSIFVVQECVTRYLNGRGFLVIGTRRFYCVACKKIMWVENESVSTFDSDRITADLIFRTGFYRNEMPLGYCGHCREIHHHLQDQEQAVQQESHHLPSMYSQKSASPLECGTGCMVH